jgi:hypothetical protein
MILVGAAGKQRREQLASFGFVKAFWEESSVQENMILDCDRPDHLNISFSFLMTCNSYFNFKYSIEILRSQGFCYKISLTVVPLFSFSFHSISICLIIVNIRVLIWFPIVIVAHLVSLHESKVIV